MKSVKTERLLGVAWCGLFDQDVPCEEGFYYCLNEIGSVTIMEIVRQDGLLMLARAGRSKMLPLSRVDKMTWAGPIPVPPSCCWPQTNPSKSCHHLSKETSTPEPLICSYLLQTFWWCIRSALRHILTKGRQRLSLLRIGSYYFLSNVQHIDRHE